MKYCIATDNRRISNYFTTLESAKKEFLEEKRNYTFLRLREVTNNYRTSRLPATNNIVLKIYHK
jgi:hypothetical protein